MSCFPIKDGIICLRNDPVEINHKGKTYRFEWNNFSGWNAVNKDGSYRLSPIPKAVWEKLERTKS